MDAKYIVPTIKRCQFPAKKGQCQRKARVFWDSGNYCRQHAIKVAEAQEKLIDWKKEGTQP